MQKSYAHIPGFIYLALALAACGANPKERGLSGGAVGAGAGAAIGAVTGMTVLQGAAIGAGIGAVVGAVTTPDQINLGSLSSSGGRKHAAAHPASSDAAQPRVTLAASPLIRDVQSALTRAGYDPGPVDGLAGPRTSSAISTYQSDNGLRADGQPSAALLQHLLSRKT